MRLKVLVSFFLLVVSVSAANAIALIGPNEIREALAAQDIVLDDYTLDHDDLNAFYAARDFRPAWDTVHHEEGSTFTAFLDSLNRVIAYHGLNPDNYPIQLMQKLVKDTSVDGPLKLELLATDTLLRLAHDTHGEGTDLDDLYPGWTLHKASLDIPAKLAEAVSQDKLSDFINGLAPDTPTYNKLASTLELYRNASLRGFPTIDEGGPLHLEDKGPRVLQLRERLLAEGYSVGVKKSKKSRSTFDKSLFAAVVDFQRRHGLEVSGYVGEKTLSELSVSAATRLNQIVANMERLRHIPDDFPPSRYALVNIPVMTLTLMKDGNELYQGPVVVGQVERKTPFIASTIRSMIINPIWHVPVKIAREDILPKLKKDPHYLEKLGFVISGSPGDPYGENIDWASMPEREFSYRLRQSPGDMNSLGRLKFDFDNEFAVYLHGTPHQELFEKNSRALSSGCVRLRDPEQIASLLLADSKEPWSVERISQEIDSKKTRWLPISDPLPIYILYWTVFLGQDGQVNFRDDVYGYDDFLVKNMKTSKG